MENPDLRISMGMKSDQKGVRVRRVDPTAPESKVLRPSDVILSFDGVDIANDGTGNNVNLLPCENVLFIPYVRFICLLMLFMLFMLICSPTYLDLATINEHGCMGLLRCLKI